MEFEFEDIINKKRPEHINDSFSEKHPKMRRSDRAKIFAPFSALSGHAETVRARERITQPKTELSEDKQDRINTILQEIDEQLCLKKSVCAEVTYFVPDSERTGEGRYIKISGGIKYVDAAFEKLYIEDCVIGFGDIYEISPK